MFIGCGGSVAEVLGGEEYQAWWSLHRGEFMWVDILIVDVNATMMQDMILQSNEDRKEQNYYWVNEVVRCEGRVTAVSGCHSPSYMIIRPRSTRKDPALLSKEETAMPKVWTQISLQRMFDMAKESTTLRQSLDPMLCYFTSRRQWTPPNSLL